MGTDDDEAQFEAALAEFAASRARRGGRPRKHYRDQLIVLAVERARKAGFKLSLGSPRCAFAEAASLLNERYGQRFIDEGTLRMAYKRRQRIERLKAQFGPYPSEVL